MQSRSSSIWQPESSTGFSTNHFKFALIELILSLRETAFDRRTLLCLPVVLRHPEPLQFPGRTDQRHFWIHQNPAVDDQTSAAGTGRRLLGRGSPAKASRVATRLQGNAEGNAAADGAAARFHSKIDAVARVQEYFAAEHRGRRPDGLLRDGRLQAARHGSRARDQRQGFISTGRTRCDSL